MVDFCWPNYWLKLLGNGLDYGMCYAAGVTESPVADPELAAATERLRLSQQAEHADRVEDSGTAPA